MRKIVAGFASSLDGYMEGPNGEIDWILINKEIDFAAYMKRFDTYFYGRKTYEAVRQAQSKLSLKSKHYVFSRTLEQVDAPFILLSDATIAQVQQIREQPGKDIAVFGGASLLTSLLNRQLVDEITVSIIPVLLGSGKPMVSVLEKNVWLSLLRTHNYSNGTIGVEYAVQYQKPG